MDEFGETPTFYVWPKGHDDGSPLPQDFYPRVYAALAAAGFDAETV